MKVLSHMKPQLQKNNEGAALVNVLLIASIAVILVSGILVVVLYNYYMKNQNIKSQQNFYDAETAMEEIRMGLTVDVSKAASIAYGDTLSRYSELSSDERVEHFQKLFREELQKKLLVQSGQIWYDVDLLGSYLKETKWDGKKGARLLTEQGQNALNVEKEGLVLKNVIISCVDDEENQTTVTSDIVLNYPPIDFSDGEAMENILCYGLIAQTAYEQMESGKTNITGNAYLGDSLTVQNGALSLQGVDGAKALGIAGDVIGDVGARVSVNNAEVWLKNIVLSNSSKCDMDNGQLYLANDMVLNSGAGVTISGELYAFGNPDAAKLAENLSKDLVSDQEADYSSSFILNGKNARLDLSQVSSLLISGVSYIHTGSNASSSSIQTGQSVMTKGDQRAYLIPGELVGNGYHYGGANPMIANQWQKLMDEIKDAKNYGSTNDVKVEDVISFQRAIPGVGGTLESIGAGNGFDAAAIQVPGMGTMYYLFMKFDSQEKANQFVKQYYQKMSNYNRLKNDLEYYAGGGVSMPSSSSDVYQFYLQGNALSNPGSKLLVNDTLTSEKNTEEARNERLQLEKELFESYGTLRCNLSKDVTKYNTKGVYENLIAKNISSQKEFTDENGNVAVVTGGNYTINNANPNIKLVIAEGNVTVAREFQGLIISKGTIKVKSGCNITADAADVAVLLQTTEVGEYIKDVSKYLVGGVGETTESEDGIALSEQVTYKNWKKK